MTEIRNSTDAGPNPAYVVADGDVVLLDPGYYLRSETEAVDMSLGYGSNEVFDNEGILDSGEDGIFEDGDYNTIVNFTNGNIYGEGYGIELAGPYARVTNQGIIEGYQAGISATGHDTNIDNEGVIDGSKLGIQLNFYKGQVTNGGQIFGGSTGVDVISSSLEGGGGVVDSIDNEGLIHGSTASISEEMGPTDQLAITNGGTLQGSVLLGKAVDNVRNTGTIVGDVRLDAGNDRFDGRGGTVTGEIFGGAGNDVILNGTDGGYVLGEAGHDTLYANTGADIFEYYTHSSLDWDVIHSFDVKHDKIQLDALDFSGLVAGKTPVVAIGTKATSASDLLFYNSSTGYLYYDQDGSGTTYKPDLVAKLDKGLAITASDFKVA